ncbi:MAG TPA: tetratricopeptide repeat protein [Gemmatimonadales bacterium]|nr:tetratricopeptide repeat protein [Gemmatimonadales bacterium]
MTVGLPGTGIGGMFYLLSALAMPLSEARRRARERRGAGHVGARGWRVVAGQTAIASGILAAMWVTGWLLGVAVHAAHPVIRLGAGSHPSNALRTAALLLSFGTLGLVLLGVEVLRLWVHRRPGLARRAASRAATERAARPLIEPRVAAAAGGRWRARTLIALLLLEALAAADPRRATGQSGSPTVARADSAFAAGSTHSAARQYAAVLAADPDNSHAIYRLGQLHRDDPAAALRLFQRYVALEPSDPWGYMAAGDVLARAGRYDDALQWYDRALRLAPAERDAFVGRARVLARARRTDAAIAAYEQCVAAHPTDAEAWRELAREWLRAGRPEQATQALERAQALAPDATTARRLSVARAAAAPAFTPLTGGSHDSDGNSTFRVSGAAELPASGPLRLGVAAGREQVAGGGTSTGLTDAALRATWRPQAALQVEAAGGATALDAMPGAGATLTPTGQLRARWRAPANGPALDLRAQRSVFDASPLLLANRVTRTELRGTLELPLAPQWKLRGMGRTAALSDPTELNHRTALGGVVAFAATPSVELSGQFHEIRYDHPDSVGYFAPQRAQIVEAGSYIEFETPASTLLAFDVAAGVQRVATWSTTGPPMGRPVMGPWRRALSLYSLMVLPLAPGRDLKVELDLEDSPIAIEAATSGQWRYASAAVSLRWALR